MISCVDCKKRMVQRSKTGRCGKCYKKYRKTAGFLNVQIRECQYCLKPISFKTKMGKRRIIPAEYKVRKFCNIKCAGGYEMTKRYRNGWITPVMKMNPVKHRPSRAELNKLFSQHRNYAKMARILGVHPDTIANWLGRKKYLLHPNMVLNKRV